MVSHPADKRSALNGAKESARLTSNMASRRPSVFRLSALCFSLLTLALSCRFRAASDAEAIPNSDAASLWASARSISVEENPIWLEYLAEGFQTIDDPAFSALPPFEPWPLARRTAGFINCGSYLTAVVNRDGFIALSGQADRTIALKQTSGGSAFTSFSVGSLLFWQNKAAAVLYRDSYFISIAPEPPEPRCYALDINTLSAIGIDPFAFSLFPAAEDWDIIALQRDREGSWRIRARRALSGESAYGKALSLDSASEGSGRLEYMEALTPLSYKEAPPPLAISFEAAVRRLDKGEALIVSTLSDKPEPVSYLIAPAGLLIEDWSAELACAAIGPDRALLLYGDGRYLRSTSGSNQVRSGAFPALPAAFRYTALADLGCAYVAAWEEQRGTNVGAAGLLLWRAPWLDQGLVSNRGK